MMEHSAEQVMDIFESFTERTPGSFLEIKV